MNFRKIYESSGLTYEKGNQGPFDKWDTSIKNAKTQKPAIKGKPHFVYEKASQPPTNKPSCPYGEDTYNVRYSKTGSLTEAEFKEFKELGILTESYEDEFDPTLKNEDEIDFDDFDLDDNINAISLEEIENSNTITINYCYGGFKSKGGTEIGDSSYEEIIKIGNNNWMPKEGEETLTTEEVYDIINELRSDPMYEIELN